MEIYEVKVYDNRTEWYQDGKYHRLDGPAVEWADGDKEWWQDGKRHRLDGPAIEYADGSKYYYINGQYLTEAKFLIHPDCMVKPVKPACSGKIVEIDGRKYRLVEA